MSGARGTVAAAVAVLLAAGPVRAHPMGNISVSHYAGIELRADSVLVKYLLDYAEIPSFRELEGVDPDRDDRVTPEEREAYLRAKTASILQALQLTVNGRPLPLASRWSGVTFPPGEGGLSTVRIAWELVAPWHEPPGARTFLVWNDGNHAGHPGWKEIRFFAKDGLSVGRTSLRPAPESDALGNYPEEYLDNPPVDTKAWCLFGPGLTEEEAARFEPPAAFGDRKKDRLVGLLGAERLSADVVVLSLLLAVVLGAAHALEPGHGKTVVAAYLVGSRGTVAQAVLLGLVVTFTHTFSVLLLGVLVLFLSRHLVPAALLPWMGFVSGLLIAAVGLGLLRARWRERQAGGAAAAHVHDHGGPAAPHVHVPEGPATLRNILALGVSGGLVPCPAGIVVLLAAVATQRIPFGLLLIVAFSLGLAAVLVGVGVLCVTARRMFDRLPASGRFANRVGMASAVLVTLFGAGLAVRSLLFRGG